MPTKPLAACLEPNCPGRAVDAGRCADHAAQCRAAYAAAHPDDRPSPSQRGYDVAWQRVRAAILHDQPWCARCLELNRRTRATDVDHIIPIADGGPRLDPRNLRSLCHAHHSQRTAYDHGFGAHRRPNLKGA